MKVSDLSKMTKQDDEGVEVVIYQRNGDPYLGLDGKPSTMTVVGSESKVYRDAERQQQRRFLKRARVAGGQITPEEMEADAIRLASCAVIAWRGWDDGAHDLPCTADNVREVLTVRHIYDQVNAAIQGHASFFEKSLAS